jgi:NitT/TauT family transport system substrate-binding protein
MSARHRTAVNARLLVVSVLALSSVSALLSLSARAEVAEITVSKEYGIGYLPYMIMEHEKLVEKYAKASGLGELKVNWQTFGGSGLTQGAILAGRLDFASSGVPWFLILWDKTNGEVKSLGAMDSMPLYLNTRNASVKSLKDFTDKDRIALPATKSSIQAMTLQMAAAQAFGSGYATKLDNLTVSLSHPDAMTALLSGISEIDSHFTSPPFQDLELKDPQIHKVLNSYDVLGGAATFIIASTTAKFYQANPKTYQSFVDALAEAEMFIVNNKREAAVIYLTMSGEKRLTADELTQMLGSPQYRFTMTPENVLKYASFMQSIGAMKNKPASWKDLFFPNVHSLPGS